MVLERPDPVVAHHADDADAVTRHRVELHPGEAEGAVAEQQADLAIGVGELGADRLAGPGAEAAERAGVHPAARLVGVDDAARRRRRSRRRRRRRSRRGRAPGPAPCRRGPGAAASAGPRAPPARRRASPPRRRAAARPRRWCGSPSPPTRRSRRGWRRRRRPGRDRGRRFAVRALGAASSRTILVSSPKLPPKPSRKSSGTPTTSATSAPLRPVPRARLKQSSWSAGRQPRPSPLRKTGMPSASASARSSPSPRPQ